MRHLYFALLATLLVAPLGRAVAPVPNSVKADGPPVVMQMPSIDRILADARTIATGFLGDGGPGLVDGFLKQKLGDTGLTALNTTQPIVGYATLSGATIDETTVIVAIAINDRDAFVKLWEKFGLPIDPVPGNDGLYQSVNLPMPIVKPEDREGKADRPLLIRFDAKHAYLCYNGTPKTVAAAALLEPAKLIDPKETALFSVKTYTERYPKEMIAASREATAKSIEDVRAIFEGGDNPAKTAAISGLVGMYQRMIEQLQNESAESNFRLMLDPKSLEIVMESSVIAKKGSLLSRDISSRSPTTNRYASLFGKDNVGNVKTRLPFFAPELRNAAILGLEEAKKNAVEHDPADGMSIAEQKVLFDGLIRTIKTGDCELVAGLNGPDTDGHYTAIVATTFDDALPLEKLIRARIADPKGDAAFKKLVKLDVAKVGTTNIHQLIPPQDEPAPPQVERIFGGTTFWFAFDAKGAYMAIGPNAKTMIAKAIEAKPAPARVFGVEVNPKRLYDLVEHANDKPEAMIEQALGNKDELMTIVAIDVTAGDVLRMKYILNLRPLVQSALGVAQFGGGLLPGPGAAPAPAPVPAKPIPLKKN